MNENYPVQSLAYNRQLSPQLTCTERSKVYKNLKNKAGRNVANNSGYLWIRIKGVFFPESMLFNVFLSFLYNKYF